MSSSIRVQRVCQQCNKEFTARTTTTRTCSDYCAKRLYKAKQKAAKVEVSNTETRRITEKPILDLKAKEFLSVADTCKLVGISRRTIYRMIERGELNIGKAGKRTIVRRIDIDRLFEVHRPTPEVKPMSFNVSECYTIAEAQSRFGISPAALQNLLKRHGISKFRQGRFTYVPRNEIDKIFIEI